MFLHDNGKDTLGNIVSYSRYKTKQCLLKLAILSLYKNDEENFKI